MTWIIPAAGAAASLYSQLSEGEKKTQGAQQAWNINSALFEEQKAAAERGADIATARTGADYGTAMANLRSSQHLQNVMQREELANRGVATGQGSIRSAGQVQQGEAQNRQQQALGLMRERNTQDIANQLESQKASLQGTMAQARLAQRQGQTTWQDVAASRVPGAVAGGAQTLLNTVL